jgi:hypothetical protein
MQVTADQVLEMSRFIVASLRSIRARALGDYLDDVGSDRIESERTRSDLIGCIASIVAGLAFLTLLLLPTSPGTGARVYILLFVDPFARMIGYWAIYQRLADARPRWAELGFYPLILGTVLLIGQDALKEWASINLQTLSDSPINSLDVFLELLVILTLPVGLAIYAWLIATTPPLRRWLGFMIIPQVVLVFITLDPFALPSLGDFRFSRLLIVYAMILSFPKEIWIYSPVARPKVR